MIDILTILFGITILYVSVTGMLGSYIKILVVQGILLFFIAILNTDANNIFSILFVAIETIVFKTILVPWFLARTIRENEMMRDVEPFIPNFFSLLIVTVFFLIGLFIASWSIKFAPFVIPLHFGISISTLMTGLLIITTRKKLITLVMGYMIMENGIFLLSLSSAKEMPMIVNLGVSLDIFIGVMLAGIVISKIKNTFDNQDDIDNLSNLKD